MKEDVKTNISEEEIILAPPTELFEEAKGIARNTKADEKFPFMLQYDANQKEYLQTMLGKVEAIVEDDDEEGHMLTTMMNMTQLAFIKHLDCVERVRTDEGSNPFLMEEAEQPATIAETPVEAVEPQTAEAMPTAKVMTIAADETVAVAAEPDMANANDGIAVANVYNTSSSCSCPTNNTMETAQEIEVEQSVIGKICCPGSEQWFKFTVPRDKRYTIYTTGSLDTVGTLFGGCTENAMVENDDFNGQVNFRIVTTLCPNTVYYIKVAGSNNETGSFTLKVTETILAEQAIIHCSNNKKVLVLQKGKNYELRRGQGCQYLYEDGAIYKNEERIYRAPVSVVLTPTDTTDKRVSWKVSSRDDIAETVYVWDSETPLHQYLVTNKVGCGQLYAGDWNEQGSKGMIYLVVTENGELVESERIDLSSTSMTLNAGDYQYLTATVYPQNASAKEVVWRSADSSIATVNSYGRVKGVKAGTTIIYAEAMDGSSTKAECMITVKDKISSLITIEDCYVRISPVVSNSGNNDTRLKNANGGSVILRASSNDTVGLLTSETITGGEYSSTNGKTRNDWYRILYNGMPCMDK